MTDALPPEIAALVRPCGNERKSADPASPLCGGPEKWYCGLCYDGRIYAIDTLRAVADNLLHRSDGYVLDPRKTDWMPLMAGLVLGRVAREYREMADRIERGEA